MDNDENKKYEDDFRTISLTSIFNSPEFEKADKLYSIDDEVPTVEVTTVPVMFNQPETPKPLKQAMSFGNVVVPEVNDEENVSNQALKEEKFDDEVVKENISFGANKIEDEVKLETKEETSSEEITLLESVNVCKVDEPQEELNVETAFCQPDSQVDEQVVQSEPILEEIQPETNEETKQFNLVDKEEIVDDVLEKVNEVENKKNEKLVEENIVTDDYIDEKEKTKEVKKEKLGFNWFFWISFVVVMIPIGFFCWILYSASTETHVPIIGSRLENSVSITISDEQVSLVQSKIAKIEGIQNASVTLNVATLRMTIDVNDDLTQEQIEEIALKCYEAVNETLPVSKYFTGSGSYKQYDLEINLYNDLDAEDLIVVTLVKNTKMETYDIQVLTTPVNKDLADQLKGKDSSNE